MHKSPPDPRPGYGVGIIGYGFMGKAHTYAHKTLPLYYKDLPYTTRMVGVCTRHENTAAQAAREQGFGWYTTDPQEIVTHPDIQMVHICTPNAQHAPWAIAALEAGKAVYCEKPLAANTQEAQAIADAVQRTGGRLQVVFHNRCFPATLRARELVEGGFLGEVTAFRVAYLHAGNIDPHRSGWRFDANQGGGGALYDLGSHLIDLFLWLCPEVPARLAAHTTILHKQRQGQPVLADDHAVMVMELANGASGTLEATKLATGIQDELRLEIHGTKGALRMNLMDANWLDIYNATVPEGPYGGERGWQRIECVGRYLPPAMFPAVKATPGWLRGHVHSLYTFMEALHNGTPMQPDARDGLRVQRLMDLAYESAEKGIWVAMEGE